MNNQIHELLQELDRIAREYDRYQAGLPIESEESYHYGKMVKAVEAFAEKVKAEPLPRPQTNDLNLMTEESFLEKCTWLMLDYVHRRIKPDLQTILNSGALNLENFGDNFFLPHAVTWALFKRYAENFKPFHEEMRKIGQNLDHFL